ncbi:MAG: PorT family protein [Rikenellaceae bacterium]|nr:PorT family protein [Rikenellaceae bacterium]
MKKAILLCAVLAAAATAVSAQPIRFGAKFGITMLSTDIKGAQYDGASRMQDEFESKNVGWNLGFFSRIEIPMTAMYVQPELVYNHAAYRLRTGDGSGQTVRYGNIELPVLVGFKILFLRANLGPTFTLATINTSGDYDVKRPDMGYQAGLGLTYFNLTIDVRYHGNFNNKWKFNTISDNIQKLKANEGYWGLSLGYFF